jgi:hypothetical protein
MSYHPEIKTIEEWNARMCGCCPMPLCPYPELECEQKNINFCYFNEYTGVRVDYPAGEIAPDLPFYRTRDKGTSQSGSYTQKDRFGENFLVQELDYNVGLTTTINNIVSDPEDGCGYSYDCVIIGSLKQEYYSYGTLARDGFCNPIGWDSGPFIFSSLEGTLEDFGGQPDFRWTPRTGQTEADRPLFPPCSPVWRLVFKQYAPIEEEMDEVEPCMNTYFRVVGSSVASTSESLVYAGSPLVPIYVPINTSNLGQIVERDIYTNEITCSDFREGAESVGDSIFNGSTIYGCSASFDCGSVKHFPQDQNNTFPTAKVFRYRFRVPPCHGGSWFKIEWDEVFFPKAYLKWLSDAEMSGITEFNPNTDPPPELPTITTKNWEWQGEALGDCDWSDPLNDYNYRKEIESRVSPWSPVIVPPDNGMVEVRNVRVYCYRSEYGSKPQYGDYPDLTNDIDQDGILDVEEL